MTLVATKATTINIEGDASLNLTNAGNTAVTLIDASKMTGGLTVQAAAGGGFRPSRAVRALTCVTASGRRNGWYGAGHECGADRTARPTPVWNDNDTMAITVGATTFTYTAAGVVDMDTAAAALATLINADAAYTASYTAATDTLQITAAVPGTPFTVSGYKVTDVANDVNATVTPAVITDNAVATQQETHTIAITVDVTDDGNETATVTYDSDGSQGAATASVAAIASLILLARPQLQPRSLLP